MLQLGMWTVAGVCCKNNVSVNGQFNSGVPQGLNQVASLYVA